MGDHSKKDSSNRRQYTRLRTVLPVDFTVINFDGEIAPGVEQERGSTHDVCRGGIALESSALNESTIRYLKAEESSLKLLIHMPAGQEPIKAVGNVAWYTKLDSSSDQGYLIGIQFTSISSQNLGLVLKHARWRKYLVQGFVVITLLVLLLIFARMF